MRISPKAWENVPECMSRDTTAWDLLASRTEETYRQVLGLASPNQRLYPPDYDGSSEDRR